MCEIKFKENPGIMAGTSKADYGRCVRIVTGAALKEMVLPGALVVAMPVAVGLIFRHFSASFQANAAVYAAGTILPVPAIAGKAVNLAGAEAVAGFATGRNDSGCAAGDADEQRSVGAWDNAKKFIDGTVWREEVGGAQGGGCRRYGRRSVQGHGWTESACAAIKLLATITLVLAPLFV